MLCAERSLSGLPARIDHGTIYAMSARTDVPTGGQALAPGYDDGPDSDVWSFLDRHPAVAWALIIAPLGIPTAVMGLAKLLLVVT